MVESHSNRNSNLQKMHENEEKLEDARVYVLEAIRDNMEWISDSGKSWFNNNNNDGKSWFYNSNLETAQNENGDDEFADSLLEAVDNPRQPISHKWNKTSQHFNRKISTGDYNLRYRSLDKFEYRPTVQYSRHFVPDYGIYDDAMNTSSFGDQTINIDAAQTMINRSWSTLPTAGAMDAPRGRRSITPNKEDCNTTNGTLISEQYSPSKGESATGR